MDRKTPAPEYRALDIDDRHRRDQFRPGDGTVRDPLSASHHRINPVESQWQLFAGVVADAFPGFGSYRVALEGIGGLVYCAGPSATSSGVYGSHEMSTLPPNTPVIVARRGTSGAAYILSPVPPMLGVKGWGGTFGGAINDSRPPDRVAVDGPDISGMKAHTAHLEGHSSPRFLGFDTGQPNDLLTGESAALTPQGVGFIRTQWAIEARVDEFTGVYAHYADQSLRIGARRMEVWGEGYRLERGHAGGEFYEEEMYSPYIWEFLGRTAPGSDPARDADREEGGDGYWEAADERQDMIPRLVTRRGPAFGAWNSTVLAPGDRDPYTLSIEDAGGRPPIGLAQDVQTYDGVRIIRAAGGVHIVTETLIAPIERRLDLADDRGIPENPNGAAEGGEADPAHRPPEAGPWSDRSWKMLTDKILLQWPALRAELYRTMTQKEALQAAGGGAAVAEPYEDLPTSHLLPDAQALELAFGLVQPIVKLYLSEFTSGLHLTREGEFRLEGRGGVSVWSDRGQLRMSAPAGCTIEAGTDFAVLAGRNAVVRAHEDLQAAAANGSVYLKGQKNVNVAAGQPDADGNPGEGMVLVSCPAPAKDLDFADKLGGDVRGSGIVLHCPEAQFYAELGSIQARVEGGTKLEGQDEIKLKGSAVELHGDRVTFNTAGASYDFKEGSARMPGSLSTGGQVSADGGGMFGGSLRTLGGVQAVQVSGQRGVGQISADQSARYQEQIQRANQSTAPEWESDDPIDQLGFSFPTSEQMGMAGWVLERSPWQARMLRRYRRTGSSQFPKWKEPAVERQGVRTMPWPGRETWEEADSMAEPPDPVADADGFSPPPLDEAWDRPAAEIPPGPLSERYVALDSDDFGDTPQAPSS